MDSVSPSFIGLIVLVIALLVPAAAGLKSLFTRSPRLQDEFVTKEEYRRQQEKVDAELARQSASRKGIYEKMEAQSKSISAIDANMTQHGRDLEALNSNLAEVNERIDAIPGRVIGLLRETKNLI